MAFMDMREIDITVELAQMELSSEEKTRLGKDLQEILEYFAQMSQIDVEGVEPTTHSLQKFLRTRPDEVLTSVLADELLDKAPEVESRLVVIPNVL